MRNRWLVSEGFWRSALFVAVTLAGLAILERTTTLLYALPHGRFAAMMIGVMRSRAIMQNPGMAGYYEQLAGPGESAGHNSSHDQIYDGSFRMYRLRPNLDRQTVYVLTAQPTNSFGFVGREWTVTKPPDTRRVALLGDSLVMGLGIDTNHTFATLLENRLNADPTLGVSHEFEVLNFAVRGYEITQMFDVEVEDASRFQPDVYILELSELAISGNWDTHITQLVQAGIDPKYDFLRETVRQAGVVQGDSFSILHSKLAPFRIPVLRETLAEMKSRAMRDHAQFIVVLVPSVEDGDLFKQRFSGIREILASLDIPVIDLLDTFDSMPDKESLRIGLADVHPNSLGHRMLVDNLYTGLRANPAIWSSIAGNQPERAHLESPTRRPRKP